VDNLINRTLNAFCKEVNELRVITNKTAR